MAVVVTGAAGFIGSHLTARLMWMGHEVIAIDRRPLGSGTTSIVADLTDPGPTIEDALREAEAVWHLAARPGVRDATTGIERRRPLDNVVTTQVVCELTPPDVPVVFTSSSSVYGGCGHGGRRRSREDDPLRPRGGYALSKVRAEDVCGRRKRAGGAVSIARPFTVAGPGQRSDMALARWITASRRGEPVTILGSLERRRDVTDVADVVRGLIGLIDSMGTVVNLGTGRSVSLADMLAAVFAATGEPTEVVIEDAPPEEVPETLASTERCAEVLGFVPRTEIRELVRRQAIAMSPDPLARLAGEGSR